MDGAIELREGVEISEMKRKKGTKPIVLGDFKHFAANVLKRIVGKDERFAEFTT